MRAVKKKLKWSRYRPGVAQRVGRDIALLFHDRGTRRGWVVSSTPRPHFSPGKTRYPFYRRLGGPQDRFRRTENLVPTGIRSWAVQPVVSRNTDWASRLTNEGCVLTLSIMPADFRPSRITKFHGLKSGVISVDFRCNLPGCLKYRKLSSERELN